MINTFNIKCIHKTNLHLFIPFIARYTNIKHKCNKKNTTKILNTILYHIIVQRKTGYKKKKKCYIM